MIHENCLGYYLLIHFQSICTMPSTKLFALSGLFNLWEISITLGVTSRQYVTYYYFKKALFLKDFTSKIMPFNASSGFTISLFAAYKKEIQEYYTSEWKKTTHFCNLDFKWVSNSKYVLLSSLRIPKKSFNIYLKMFTRNSWLSLQI